MLLIELLLCLLEVPLLPLVFLVVVVAEVPGVAIDVFELLLSLAFASLLPEPALAFMPDVFESEEADLLLLPEPELLPALVVEPDDALLSDELPAEAEGEVDCDESVDDALL